jgi:hypothetical protein
MRHVIKMPLTPDQMTWLAKQSARPILKTKDKDVNPCVQIYGSGPDGVTCKTCSHLFRHKPGNKVFLKCDIRDFTRGKGTDHKAGWPACGKYEKLNEKGQT